MRQELIKLAFLALALVVAGCSSSVTTDPPAAQVQVRERKYGCESSNPVLLSPRSREIRKLPELEIASIDPAIEPQVHRELRKMLRDKPTLRSALKNRHQYRPKLREIFLDEGVPEGLIDLAFVESRFRTAERSPAGAVGMWQFTKDTGRQYGLEIGVFEDQRRDAVLSSIAAARHLYDLYGRFDDWLLAVAAYNAGSGAIAKGMGRSGARDFTDLARSGEIPSETTQFVYRFLAVSLMLKEPRRYGLVIPSSRPSELALRLSR